MKYRKGDQVTLNRDYLVGETTFPRGTGGIVLDLLPTLDLYEVQFPGRGPIRVPESFLS